MEALAWVETFEGVDAAGRVESIGSSCSNAIGISSGRPYLFLASHAALLEECMIRTFPP